jgi:hypothetical protein
MKCEKVMKKFMELEYYRVLPLSVRFHLLSCEKCAAEIADMTASMDGMRSYLPHEMAGDQIGSIMRAVGASGVSYSRKMPMLNWLSAGIILIASLVLVQFSETLIWLKDHFGRDLEVPLNIVLGIVFSIYSIIFIGTHLDELKDYFGQTAYIGGGDGQRRKRS